MTMYFCPDCKEIIEEECLELYYEDPSPCGVGLPSGYETYARCPHCGSFDIEEFICDEDCNSCPYSGYCDNAVIIEDEEDE